MTTVVCWMVQEDGAGTLWVVAGSLISRINSNGNSVPQIEVYPKISSIPIKLFWDACMPIPREITSIGFAYAGSVLIASITKEILTTLLGGLGRIQNDVRINGDPKIFEFWKTDLNFCNADVLAVLPTLKEVANLTRDIVADIYQSYGNWCGGGEHLRSEIMVFGFCWRTLSYKAFSIRTNNVPPAIEEICLEEGAYVFGDKIDKINEFISIRQDSCCEIISRRAPLYAVCDAMDDEAMGTIGGDIALATCSQFGVFLKGMSRMVGGVFETNYFGFKLKNNRLGECLLNTITMSHPKDFP